VKLEEKISSEKRCTNSKKDGVNSEKVVKKIRLRQCVHHGHTITIKWFKKGYKHGSNTERTM